MKAKADNSKKVYIWLIILFMFAWFSAYGNRMVLSPLLTTFEEMWKIDGTKLGWLNSGFYFSYFIFQIPFGILAVGKPYSEMSFYFPKQ